MKIEYFELSCYGNIHKMEIDTSDEKYVSNDGRKVKIIEYDDDGYSQKVEYFMNFEDTRQDVIEFLKKDIFRLQKDLAVFENSKNYDNYWELQRENIKNNP